MGIYKKETCMRTFGLSTSRVCLKFMLAVGLRKTYISSWKYMGECVGN